MQRSRRQPTHPYPRMARVNALLLRVLADELTRLSDADERLRLLTFTEVLCEPDLRHATVLLSSLPEEGALALEEHRRRLQATISTEIRMKRVPALAFRADPAIEAGRRVEEALRRARGQVSGPSG